MRPKRIRCSIKFSLKSAIAFLILASASLVEAQTIQTLCSFNFTNGAYPYTGLTLGNDDNFYGTTGGGGITNSTFPIGMGTVFKVTTNGALTTLVVFNGNNGERPYTELTLGNDGNLYGTTMNGGVTYSTFSSSMGTVFKMTTNGTLTTLVNFNSTNGAEPRAALTLCNDGNFYGTTSGGGATDCGTVFKVTTNGALTTLVSFNGNNGAQPFAALTLGKDGNFYGTTFAGGITNSAYPDGMGTMFKVTTNGALTTLVYFNSTNGAYPRAALTLSSDGNFHSTTGLGGITNSSFPRGMGTVFKVTTNGTLTTLVFFNGYNGASPNAVLALGKDGNFYGTTGIGGEIDDSNPGGMGTVFRVTTNGTLTTLVYFNMHNGMYPEGLTLGFDGIYGTTAQGGSTSPRRYGYGTVFHLQPQIIIDQPQSQINIAGATVTFQVSAADPTEPNPMSYQWQKDGTNLVNGGNITGATTDTLTITSISNSDVAAYSITVSNANRSETSSTATLTIIEPPSITAHPTNLLVLSGTNAAFGVSLSGTPPLLYQWRFNGTNLLNATNAIYSIPSVRTNNAGSYAVVVTNAARAATSSNAVLTVVLSPKSRTNNASSTATFTATVFGPELLNYQWQKNGTNLAEGGRLSGTTTNTLTITSVSDQDAANYSAVVSGAYASVTTSNAALTVNDLPFIASQPQSQTVLAGSNVTFDVIAYGASPLVFQWSFNGASLGSPTTGTNFSSCTLTNVGTDQAGTYRVQVVNGYGTANSSNATLAVVTLPPAITTQPTSRTNNAGTTATFFVIASSLSSLSYQWQKGGMNLVNGGTISGATTNTLTIANVASSDAAAYSVIVTNLAGSVTSSNATLTVIIRPRITTQPLGQRVLLGGSVSFRVSVSGTAPFRYQWRHNGTSLLDATNAAYEIQSVYAANTGNYSLVVTNLAGSATSSNALLTVVIPPTLALELLAGYPLLNLEGMLSSNFVVQYSTNLGDANWINLLSLTNLPASPYQFIDPADASEPVRFYRVFMR